MERSFTENEMREIVEKIQPVFNTLQELIADYGMEGFITITSWNDGLTFCNGPALSGWSIDQDTDRSICISYKYTKKLEKENKDE